MRNTEQVILNHAKSMVKHAENMLSHRVGNNVNFTNKDSIKIKKIVARQFNNFNAISCITYSYFNHDYCIYSSIAKLGYMIGFTHLLKQVSDTLKITIIK